mgnify:CR=1 FL=1
MVKQSNKKQNGIDENGYQYVHIIAKKLPLTKSNRMVYGVKVIRIQPVKEYEFITDVIKLKDVGNILIYSTRTSLFISKSGVYAYLTILRNGEQQPALVLLFLKAMFASTSSGCVSD